MGKYQGDRVCALKDQKEGQRLVLIRSIWHYQWKGKRPDNPWGLWKKNGVERSVRGARGVGPAFGALGSSSH